VGQYPRGKLNLPRGAGAPSAAAEDAIPASTTPAEWRKLADQARAAAERMTLPEAVQILLSIAHGYERLAELPEKAGYT
jgi:hypothetical protein